MKHGQRMTTRRHTQRAAFAASLCAGALLALLVAPAVAAQPVEICVPRAYVEELSELDQRFERLELIAYGDQGDLLTKVGECEAIVGLFLREGMDDILRAGPGLRWIQTLSAGVERFLRSDELVASDVVLTNTRIIQGPEIADHALGLLLNLTRDLKFYNEQMEEGAWQRRSRLPVIELRGKTALIIGLGGIGTQIAQRAAAFGMRVLAVDPKDIPLHRDVAYVGKPDELDELLPEADVVFSSVPLTPASRGMLGAAQFERMKEGVYVINVSRGGIVDTAALTEALRSGKVRAAGLDVTDPEPLPPDHPLWGMPNVTVTPHIATLSDVLEERRLGLYRDNIERYLTGQPLRNVVDKRKGY